LLIFVLVTWNLSVVFAQSHPDLGGWLTTGIALIAATLFFIWVLVHELAHSLVTKARGMPVRSIKLFLFGGISNIEREPPSPGAVGHDMNCGVRLMASRMMAGEIFQEIEVLISALYRNIPSCESCSIWAGSA
jgi:Zn-dependent protease